MEREILIPFGLGFCQINRGSQNNENNSSVVTHLPRSDFADRHHLSAGDDGSRTASFSETGKRLAHLREQQTRGLGLARAEV